MFISKVKGIFGKDSAQPAPPAAVAAAGITARSGAQAHIWPLDPATKAALAGGAARYNCKVLIRGARGTGKSTLLSMLTGASAPQGPSQSLSAATIFVPFAAPSLGTAEAPTVLPIDSGLHEAGLPAGAGAKVELWDVVDEAAARGGADSRAIDVYRGCNAVIFMVDVRSRASFEYVEAECRRVPPSCCTLVCLNFMDAVSAVAATAAPSNESFALPPGFVTEEEVDRLCQSMPRVSTPERTQLCLDLTTALAQASVDGAAAGIVESLVMRAGDTAAVASWLPVALAPRTGDAFGINGIKNFLLAPMHLQNVAALELQMRQSFEAMELVRAHLLLLRAQMHQAQKSAAADARRERAARVPKVIVGPAAANEAARAAKAADAASPPAASPTKSSPASRSPGIAGSNTASPSGPVAPAAASQAPKVAQQPHAPTTTAPPAKPAPEAALKFEAPKKPTATAPAAELGGAIDNFFDDVDAAEEETPEAKARRQKEFFGGDSSSEDEPTPVAASRTGLRVLGGRGRAPGLSVSSHSAMASASASPTTANKGPTAFVGSREESPTAAVPSKHVAAPAIAQPQQPLPPQQSSSAPVGGSLMEPAAPVPVKMADVASAVAATAAAEERRLQAALDDMLAGPAGQKVDDFFGSETDEDDKTATSVVADPAPAIAVVAPSAADGAPTLAQPAAERPAALVSAAPATQVKSLGRLGGRRKQQQGTSDDDDTPAPAAPTSAKGRPVVGTASSAPTGGAAALGVDVAALLAQMQSSLATAPVDAGEGDAEAYGGAHDAAQKEKKPKRDKAEKAEKKEKREKKEKKSRAAEDSDA